MAYLDISDKDFLQNIADRKEFQIRKPPDITQNIQGVFTPQYTTNVYRKPDIDFMPTPSQIFIPRFIAQKTPYKRALLVWKTGSGKTRPTLQASKDFIKIKPHGRVFIIGFTEHIFVKSIFQYPDLEILPAADYQELKEMIAKHKKGLIKNYAYYLGALKRKLHDPARGGYFTFYGYEELANAVFEITMKGKETRFTVQEIMGASKDFNHELNVAITNGLVKINTELIESMAENLIIVDEIHLTYNVSQINIFGRTIEYILDVLDKRAPKAIYLSATPLTGSATEIVPVINLLVPKSELPDGKMLTKSDLFTKQDDIAVLKPGADAIIRRLLRGRISLLSESTEKSSDYPRRILVGESVDDIKYLRFTVVQASKLHDAALNGVGNVPIDGLGLYDLVFPGGIYKTDEVFDKCETRVISKRGYQFPLGFKMITGAWLEKEKLGEFSAKYVEMLNILEKSIKAGEDRIVVFHNNIQAYGIALIYEILLYNGFIELGSAPGNNTRCSRCYETKKNHGSADHKFRPAVVAAVHSMMPAKMYLGLINEFNTTDNITVLVGSHKIYQSETLMAVRVMIVASLVVDIAFLIQLYGRGVRRGTHAALDPDLRYVKIYTIITKSDKNFDIQRYKAKMEEYYRIQHLLKLMYEGAVDNFMNYKALPESLDDIEFKPEVSKSKDSIDITYFAHEYALDDLEKTRNRINELFSTQKIWKKDELSKIVSAEFSKELYDVGLRSIIDVSETKNYLIYGPVDHECYLRPTDLIPEVYNISKSLEKKNMKIEASRIGNLDDISEILLFSKGIQEDILKSVITGLKLEVDIPGPIIDLYTKLKILVSGRDLSTEYRTTKKYAGYYGSGFINLYIDSDRKWIKINVSEQPVPENDTIIGFGTNKIRYPLRVLKGQTEGSDFRKVMKGAVCSNWTRETLIEIGRKLGTTSRCQDIIMRLLANEIRDRGRTKWFYLPFDIEPDIRAETVGYKKK